MADICEVTIDDVVIDPACGTGGFLIAAMQRVFETTKPQLRYEAAIEMVRHKLIGYDSEPITAALCVANMLLRGDGKTGIRRDKCFTAPDYPIKACDVALMNPPFPHKKTDSPPQRFVERALEALHPRGRCAVILPTSLLVKKDIGAWRKKILAQNSLLAVCQLPDEIFQPYASTTTSVILLGKGIPHSTSAKQTVFTRIEFDGLTLKKSARVNRTDGKNQISAATEAVVNKRETPGFAGVTKISGDSEWSPGAYIPSAIPTNEELKNSIDELLRRLASFYIRYAREVANLRRKVSDKELTPRPYREMLSKQRLNNAAKMPSSPNTIGKWFDLFYGQKELHSRDGMVIGDALVVSPTEQYNGCYGWLFFENIIEGGFVTVAQTGTIGEAFVQLEPCGVNDDCLILMPKDESLPLSCLFIAAAIIRLERWRFSYGRKLTPSRICSFPMERMPDLEAWVETKFSNWKKLTEEAVSSYSDN